MNLSLGNFSLKSIRQRDWTIIVIVLTVLGAVAWYYWMFTPTQDRIADLRLDIDQLEADIQVGKTARANLPQLEADIAQARADRDAFLVLLPRESEVSNLIETLRQTAVATGIDLDSIDQSGAQGQEIQDVRALGFSLATQGNFGETMSFTDSLENLDRFTRVSQVDLSITEDGIENPDLNANYDFTVYVYTGTDEPSVDPDVDPDTEAAR